MLSKKEKVISENVKNIFKGKKVSVDFLFDTLQFDVNFENTIKFNKTHLDKMEKKGYEFLEVGFNKISFVY